MELFFELLLCAFAVFGLWCALRLGSESLFLSRQIAPSVMIRTVEDVRGACGLLREARATLSCRRGETIVVLCDERLTDRGRPPEILTAACRRHGARCFVVAMNEEKINPLTE